jgi:hypothetical protein
VPNLSALGGCATQTEHIHSGHLVHSIGGSGRDSAVTIAAAAAAKELHGHFYASTNHSYRLCPSFLTCPC